MASIIPQKHLNGLEAYLVLDKPLYKPGSEAKAHVLLENKGVERSFRLRIIDEKGGVQVDKNISIKAGERLVDISPVSTMEDTGFHKLRLYIDSTLIDEVGYITGDPASRRYMRVAFVWHNHQAPNYGPDGRFHADWAFTYVYRDLLKPYGLGPYHYHTTLLDRHPGYSATFNLSPSLLYQWDAALKKGVDFKDGRRLDKGSREVQLIGETLEKYAEYARSGRIDVLTSVYAHTILGFLTDTLNAQDIVAEEVEYGAKVTREVLGGFEPIGFWTPEMAFSMKLVRILQENRLEYTILDDANHLYYAEGERSTPYEPYILLDPGTRSHIQVFFRDSYLSNVMSFQNNFTSELHAWRNAYELAYMISSKWVDKNTRILTIALDGENWMVFSKNPPLTAYFVDKLILYLEALSDFNFIKTINLRGALEEVPARRVITNIPTNTWLGTFRKWRGEVVEQERWWVQVAEAIRLLRVYENVIQGRDSYSNSARFALWHALNSDYWWAEFWSPGVINMWLERALKTVQDRLSNIRIVDVKVRGDVYLGGECELGVSIENNLDRDVKVSIVIVSWGVKEATGVIRSVSLKARTVSDVPFKVRAVSAGDVPVSVLLLSDNSIVASYTKNIYISQRLPPNPR
jgi:hypothetical protein